MTNALNPAARPPIRKLVRGVILAASANDSNVPPDGQSGSLPPLDI